MMQEITLILKCLGVASISYLWVVSEPTQWLRSRIGMTPDNDKLNKLGIIIMGLLNCELCMGFWIGLLWFHTLPMAALISVLSVIISNIATPKLN